MIDHSVSAPVAYRTHVRIAVMAAWLLTRYWFLARTGSSPADLGARLGGGPSDAVPSWLPSTRVVAIVARVARLHPLRPTCLPQALTVCHLLARAGRRASVRLGVDRADGHLLAHAWVHAPDLPDVSCHTGFEPLGDIHPQSTT